MPTSSAPHAAPHAAYRPDIDGLRAIAVLAVVLYHAGFTRFFGGGYVGVDVFFVLSGYLITGIVYRECRSGTFSFLNFYERRIRRIVPAFVVMGFGSTALAYFALSPDFFKNHGVALYRATLCMANFYFMRHSGGYFDTPTQYLDLLHTWSLSVEEQFYFIFPALLLLSLKFFPRHAARIVLGGALLSFAAAAVMVFFNQEFAFYMLPTRAWELLCGSLLAVMPIGPLSERRKAGLMLAGVVLILGSISLYGLFPYMPFPGPAALPPCLGTALCIVGGMERERKGVLYGLLSCRPMVFIGLISYSLYLWHWPLLALYRSAFFTAAISEKAAALIIGFSFLLAIASWRLVERPVRQKKVLRNRYALFAVALIVLAAQAELGWSLYRERITPFVPFASDNTYQAGATDIAQLQNPAPEAWKSLLRGIGGFFGDPEERPSILLLGDSHANAISQECEKIAREHHRAGVLVSYHLPFLNNRLSEDKEPRAPMHQDVRDLIAELRPDTLLITARYRLYLGQFLPNSVAAMRRFNMIIEYEPPDGEPVTEPRQALHDSLRDTLEFAFAHGVRRVFIFCPVPEQPYPVPSAASRMLLFGMDPEEVLFTPLDQYRKYEADVMEVLSELAREYPAVELLDPVPSLCPDGEHCRGVREGVSLYYDENHLSTAGAALLEPLLSRVFTSPEMAKDAAP